MIFLRDPADKTAPCAEVSFQCLERINGLMSL